jgi:DNA-binding MarR family transcriptional regulator
MIGALLRLTHQEMLNGIEAGLNAAGMSEVRSAHFAVTQQLGARPEGVRLTELATYAGITKPSMSALVDDLERSGYVERVDDPTDQRAQLIRFTAKGRRLAEVAIRVVKKMEANWAKRIGQAELETLRRLLRTIVSSRPQAGDR